MVNALEYSPVELDKKSFEESLIGTLLWWIRESEEDEGLFHDPAKYKLFIEELNTPGFAEDVFLPLALKLRDTHGISEDDIKEGLISCLHTSAYVAGYEKPDPITCAKIVKSFLGDDTGSDDPIITNAKGQAEHFMSKRGLHFTRMALMCHFWKMFQPELLTFSTSKEGIEEHFSYIDEIVPEEHKEGIIYGIHLSGNPPVYDNLREKKKDFAERGREDLFESYVILLSSCRVCDFTTAFPFSDTEKLIPELDAIHSSKYEEELLIFLQSAASQGKYKVSFLEAGSDTVFNPLEQVNKLEEAGIDEKIIRKVLLLGRKYRTFKGCAIQILKNFEFIHKKFSDKELDNFFASISRLARITTVVARSIEIAISICEENPEEVIEAEDIEAMVQSCTLITLHEKNEDADGYLFPAMVHGSKKNTLDSETKRKAYNELLLRKSFPFCESQVLGSKAFYIIGLALGHKKFLRIDMLLKALHELLLESEIESDACSRILDSLADIDLETFEIKNWMPSFTVEDLALAEKITAKLDKDSEKLVAELNNESNPIGIAADESWGIILRDQSIESPKFRQASTRLSIAGAAATLAFGYNTQPKWVPDGLIPNLEIHKLTQKMRGGEKVIFEEIVDEAKKNGEIDEVIRTMRSLIPFICDRIVAARNERAGLLPIGSKIHSSKDMPDDRFQKVLKMLAGWGIGSTSFRLISEGQTYVLPPVGTPDEWKMIVSFLGMLGTFNSDANSQLCAAGRWTDLETPAVVGSTILLASTSNIERYDLRGKLTSSHKKEVCRRIMAFDAGVKVEGLPFDLAKANGRTDILGRFALSDSDTWQLISTLATHHTYEGPFKDLFTTYKDSHERIVREHGLSTVIRSSRWIKEPRKGSQRILQDDPYDYHEAMINRILAARSKDSEVIREVRAAVLKAWEGFHEARSGFIEERKLEYEQFMSA